MVLPQGGIFAAYQADGTPTGDYELPSDFRFTFADGTTVSGAALAALFDQEGAAEHLEYSNVGSGDGYTSYKTITGDIQNAPTSYLAAEQNGGGPAAPGASTGTATVTDTGSNIAFGYDQGDGTLEITPNYRSIVQFASSIVPSSVAARGDSQGNLTLTDGTNGDQVVLDGMLTDPSRAVQSVSFADGTTWTAAQTLGFLNTTGTAGNDTLYGSYLPEVFDGQGAPSGAKDLVVGNGGADTFAFNQGYGALEVNEQDDGSDPANVLRLGAGVTASDVSASENAGGDIILRLGANGDQVTLDGMAANAADGVQSVVFADGTTWNTAQVFSLLPNTIGTTGSDTLYGTWGANVFDGKGAPSGTKDVEIGFGGGDTFIFNQGYGALEINEQDAGSSPMNVLQLGAGITASSVTVTGNANGDVILTLGTSGDQVTLDGMSGTPYFFGPRSGSGVQSVIFSDGTTWSADRICSVLKPHVTGTSGADNLLGTSTGEYIDGLGAPAGSQDYERGGGGSDTFIYKQGYGQLEVDETDYYSYKPDNVLQLGAGITASQLTVTSDSAGNVYLADGTAGDRIKLDVELGGFLQGVQSVQFDDGTVLTQQQLAILATTGTTGADNLYGTHDADTFDGKGAPAGSQDYEHGGGGGDTFVYNQGYGQLEVDENNVSGANATLQLGAGIDPSRVRVTADTSNDLILTDGVNGDRITLDQMLAADPYGDTPYGVGQVTFSDGTTWSRDQLVQRELASGTSGNDTLIGSAGPDLFDGHGGNDYEQGNGGADTFVFDQGYGQLEVKETSGGQATLQLGSGLTPEQVLVRADAAGDAILTFGGDPGDQVRIDQMLAADPYGGTPYGVGQVTFSDGTTWSRDQLVQRELASASSGNDTLIGGTGADLFDGRGGNDYEQGNGGGDTFVFDQGYGQLEINERQSAYTPDNVLALGAGIDPSQLRVTRDNLGNIYLADGTAGDQIKLDGELNGSSYGVQGVQFADGSSLTWAQVIALAPLEGTTGADTLYGTSGADTFDGKGAPAGSQDYEQGNGGNDTFVFNPGYGQLEVDEADSASSPANTLRFGPGILPSQVSLNGDYDDWNLNVTVGTGGDTVVLDDQLLSPSYGVQRMSFADGTTWDRAEIVRQTGLGMPGKPVLYGSSGDDVFDPRGQAHEIWGWGGSDTYMMDRGDGGVTIHNSYNSSSPHGHLAFSGTVASDQLWFAQSGDDLVATVLGTTDQATVKSWFTDPGAPTSDIEAAGGARLDAGLGQLVSSMASYQAANPGFNPATASAMPDDPSLRSAIAAAWHG